MEAIYYIENTISEYSSAIKGYFETLEEAKENLKECGDWYSPWSGGKIYQIEFGLRKKPTLIFKGIYNEKTNTWEKR